MSSTIIPTMRYNNPNKAIDFLCGTFGFKVHQLYKDESGLVIHAELRHGTGLIMIGPNLESEFGKHIKQPKEIGGFETQISFIIVENLTQHYEHAMKNGAEIIIPLKKQSYGASDYVCRDNEGHIWSFGDYNPWKKST